MRKSIQVACIALIIGCAATTATAETPPKKDDDTDPAVNHYTGHG